MGACQSSARNGYARQTTEATLPPSPLLAFMGCRMWPFPHKTPETPVLERLPEQAPDMGIASGPQAVPARLGAMCDAARSSKGGAQMGRETGHCCEPRGSPGCPFLILDSGALRLSLRGHLPSF